MITIPNITIPVIGLPTIGIPSVGFPSASGGGLAWPAGLKESIKAIYDPAKQGMTNYDVIEAYVEDFTTWSKGNPSNIFTVSNKSITVTVINAIDNILLKDKQGVNRKYSIKISGLPAGAVVIYGNITENTYYSFTSDGTYTVDDSTIKSNYVGIKIDFIGTCNITITQLPTSVLKDLSGNGNHAYLYGGKGKLNSGMGVYQEDFTTFTYSDKNADLDVSPNKFIINELKSDLGILYVSNPQTINSINIEVKGDFNGVMLRYLYGYNGANKFVYITEPGIYNLPASDGSNAFSGFYGSDKQGECNITITQIPDYPNQLCYDGSMYAVCYGFPILTDYTVIADRTWFSLDKRGAFSSKSAVSNTGAFIFEFNEIGQKTFSYGNLNSLSGFVTGITYQTKNSYNKEAIKEGNITDTDELIIGTVRVGDFGGYVGCHGKIIVADRSFTEDEITWLKDNWKKI